MSKNIWYEKEIAEMLNAVALTREVKEVEALFEMILTPREINDMARRLKVKKMLEEGFSYTEISEKLGVGPVIISRVSNQIGYGFRRAKAESEGPSIIKKSKPIRKYKGAVPIHRIFG